MTISAFDEKVGELHEYGFCLSEMDAARKKEKADKKKEQAETKKKEQRKQRYEKKKVVESLLEAGAPDALAESIGTALGLSGLDSSYSAGYSPEFATEQDFAHVAKAFGMIPDAAKSYWHNELLQSCRSVAKQVGDKAIECKEKCDEKECTHTVRALNPVSSFRPNDPDNKSTLTFQMKHAVPTLMFYQLPWAFDVTLECLPLQGCGGFITIMQGTASITCVQISEIVAAGVDNLGSYLASETFEKFIGKTPTFTLNVEQSIYIPFGTVPIIIGLGDETTCDPLVFLFTVLADETYKKSDEAVRLMVGSSIGLTLAKNPKCLKTVRDQLAEWKKEIENVG